MNIQAVVAILKFQQWVLPKMVLSVWMIELIAGGDGVLPNLGSWGLNFSKETWNLIWGSKTMRIGGIGYYRKEIFMGFGIN